MNNCSFIGRLTTDPEVKTTSSGKALINFSIAVDRDYKNSDGSRPVDFIPCIAWEPVANIITRYAHKGDKLGVSGRFETNNYTDSNGEKKTFYRILVNQVDLIQNKAKDEAPRAEVKEESGDDDLDLPFPV